MSMIVLAFLASVPAPLTADAAMDRYRAMTSIAAARRARCAAGADSDEIVVCATDRNAFRLPMRDAAQRAAGGDLIRHPDELPKSSGAVDIAPCHPICPDAPHAPETISRILSWLKGEDPD